MADKVKLEGLDLPLFSERPVKTVGILVVTGDRGLCGSYNNKLIQMAERRVKELVDMGINVKLLLAGTKGQVFFKRNYSENDKIEVIANYSMNNTVSSEFSRKICDEAISNFYAGEIDRIELVYTKFVSLIACDPSIRTLLPLAKTGLESEYDEMFRMTTKDGKLEVEIDAVKNETKEIP